jgi:hypothetical protein
MGINRALVDGGARDTSRVGITESWVARFDIRVPTVDSGALGINSSEVDGGARDTDGWGIKSNWVARFDIRVPAVDTGKMGIKHVVVDGGARDTPDMGTSSSRVARFDIRVPAVEQRGDGHHVVSGRRRGRGGLHSSPFSLSMSVQSDRAHKHMSQGSPHGHLSARKPAPAASQQLLTPDPMHSRHGLTLMLLTTE